jgi:bifunctional DNA-binding transcriptional regulator/antitoxin component of YhaV-PrlF toxin-antitoxin module
MLKALSLSTISPNRTISIKKEIMDLLDINFDDEILFVLDKNGTVNIRKFEENMTLGTGEKYISTSHIFQHRGQIYINLSIAITGDVRRAVNADVGDKVLWTIDNDGNIIIRNDVIIGECSTNIFNKDIGALIIGLTQLPHHSKTLPIPKEIKDILGMHEGDKIILSLDEYSNIIVSAEAGKKAMVHYDTHLIDVLINILDNTDKILWFVDEEGNIIIKNDLLPDNCM